MIQAVQERKYMALLLGSLGVRNAQLFQLFANDARFLQQCQHCLSIADSLVWQEALHTLPGDTPRELP